MRIALDAMGGDHAPGPIVAGAVRAAQANPELRVVLIGDQTQVEPLLAEAGAARERLELFHASQTITMDETPIVALRKKPDSSISRCWQLLAERKVDAIVSFLRKKRARQHIKCVPGIKGAAVPLETIRARVVTGTGLVGCRHAARPRGLRWFCSSAAPVLFG